MTGRVLHACLFAVLVVTSTPVAAAGAENTAAREYNRKAIDAFKAGHHDEALENFERAFELFPDPKVRLNLGISNETLRRLDEAKAHYEAFLRENPRSDKAANVKSKLAGVEKKMKQWGKVVVYFEPPPDSAQVDNVTFKSFPMKIWLEPGKHKLVATKQGYEPVSQPLKIAAGVRSEVSVTMRPVAASDPPVAAKEAPAEIKEVPVAASTEAPPPSDVKAPAAASTEKAPVAKASAPPSKPTASPEKRTSVPGIAMRAVGGLSIAGGVVALLAALAGGAASGGALGAWLTTPGLDPYRVPMEIAVYGGVVLLGVGLVVTLIALAAGGALLGASFAF